MALSPDDILTGTQNLVRFAFWVLGFGGLGFGVWVVVVCFGVVGAGVVISE